MALLGLGRFSPSTTALFLCDMQAKFQSFKFENIVINSNTVLHAAQLMSIPTFATEQYPKGLGSTVPELELAKFNIVPHSKTSFTMVIPELLDQMRVSMSETKSVILCGIEARACITATTLGNKTLVPLVLSFKRMIFPKVLIICIFFIYFNKVAVCLCVRNIFLYNHLLLCHDYPSLSSNFYQQGKTTTTNSISYFCVMITKVLVQTFNTGENINGATLPVSQLEQGGTWGH